jgi:hypothetical protein
VVGRDHARRTRCGIGRVFQLRLGDARIVGLVRDTAHGTPSRPTEPVKTTSPSTIWAYSSEASFQPADAILKLPKRRSYHLPQNERLVAREVENKGPVVGPYQFGFELGTGVRTYVTTTLPYALLLACIFLASPVEALLTGLSFGLGRSLMVLARAGSGHRNDWDDQLNRQINTIVKYSSAVGAICVVGLAAPSF